MKKVYVVIRQESCDGIHGVWVFDTEVKAFTKLSELYDADLEGRDEDHDGELYCDLPEGQLPHYWIPSVSEADIYESEVSV